MKIQRYLEEIRNLKNLTLDKNPDLENIVDDIVSNESNIEFTVEDFFENEKLKLVSKIEQNLNLAFTEEENTNLCFINSTELRSEYKQSFRLNDLLDYMYAFAHSSLYSKSQKIIIGSDTEVFWNVVKIGSDLKKKI
ncbi:hypothetical protein L1276_001315 [Flavobacterium sp. HSC-32F16]|uniref:hypothetical protein n=1 Tax=Flavobacterium sp. HSC-32F16 TaxID=2910964 RepID=UPI0020A39CB2|nr:hypothetical protein [Flavobacterium sp. HSC-32F16]MCP2026175.1 hypothetical protein [Flavobacterium sp. HSC-32F16]